jgi:hypothetical protein
MRHAFAYSTIPGGVGERRHRRSPDGCILDPVPLGSPFSIPSCPLPAATPARSPWCGVLNSYCGMRYRSAWSGKGTRGVKPLIEILLAIFLHPIVVILVWIDLSRRRDIGLFKKVLWGLVALVWGLGPLLYVFLGDGHFW